jgi:large subunit ribosomal protein L22
MRLVAGSIRNKKAADAIAQLALMLKGARTPVKKALESCVANAVNNYELDRDNLFIKEIRIDEGRTLKRFMPRAYGRATPIRKRTSHIKVVLGEIKDSGKKIPKKAEVEAPVSLDEMAGGEGEKEEKKKKNKNNDKKSNK